MARQWLVSGLSWIIRAHRHQQPSHGSFSSSSSHRYSVRFLPVFATVDIGNVWHSQVCPRVIGGIDTCHKMRHSPYMPTVTYRRASTFSSCPTTPFLHSQPIQTSPSGPGLICAAGQVFIWDDPSVTPLS